MSETFDEVIAGGAIIGSSTAYHLASDPGFKGRILVVEKDMSYTKCATTLSLSSVRQQYSTAIKIRVGLAGVAFVREAGVTIEVDGDKPDLPFVENGYLYLAGDAGAEVLRENNAIQTAEGANIALLSPDEIKARYPFINVEGVTLGSLGLTGEGWFDSYQLLQAFRRKARSLGVVYREDRVVSVEREGGRVTGVTLAGGDRIGCGVFLDSAGASGAAEIARGLGVEIPIQSRKRSVFVFETKEQHDDCPLLIDTTGVFFRPSGGKHWIVGVSPPEEQDPECFDFEVRWEEFEDILWPAMAHRVPAFENIKLVRAWAGHYDLNVFDHNAIVGRLPGYENAYLAAGFSGHGEQQSPAVGRGLAELIAHGGFRTLDLSDFAFERIAAGRPLLEKNVI